MLKTFLSIMLCVSSPLEVSSLEKAVASGDPKVIEQVVREMAKGASANDMDQLIEHALLADNPTIENAALNGLEELTPGPGLTWLCTQAKEHPQKQVRDLLIRYLGTRQDVNSFKAVLQGLYDQEDSVALGAIQTLLDKEHSGSIPHLIRALQYQEDRDRDLCLVAEKLRNTLSSLTGVDLFASSEWDALWKKQSRCPEREGKTESGENCHEGYRGSRSSLPTSSARSWSAKRSSLFSTPASPCKRRIRNRKKPTDTTEMAKGKALLSTTRTANVEASVRTFPIHGCGCAGFRRN